MADDDLARQEVLSDEYNKKQKAEAVKDAQEDASAPPGDDNAMLLRKLSRVGDSSLWKLGDVNPTGAINDIPDIANIDDMILGSASGAWDKGVNYVMHDMFSPPKTPTTVKPPVNSGPVKPGRGG